MASDMGRASRRLAVLLLPLIPTHPMHAWQVDAIGENGKALFARQFHIPLFGHANGFSNNLQAQVNKHGL